MSKSGKRLNNFGYYDDDVMTLPTEEAEVRGSHRICNEQIEVNGNFASYCTRRHGHQGNHYVSQIRGNLRRGSTEMLPDGQVRVITKVDGREVSEIVELKR